MNVTLGIDPGKSGGIAWIDGDGVIHCVSMPQTDHDVVDLVRSIVACGGREMTAYMEEVPKFCGPRLPGSAIAPLFQNIGLLRGALAAFSVPTVLVRPHEWQRGFNLGTRGTAGSYRAWKLKLKAEAQRRFPTLTVTHAVADALLILEYAKRHGQPE